MAKDDKDGTEKAEKPKSVEDLQNRTKVAQEENQAAHAEDVKVEGEKVSDKVAAGAEERAATGEARAEAQTDARTHVSDSQVAGITSTVDEGGRTAGEQEAEASGEDYPVDNDLGVASTWARAEDGQLHQVRQLDTRG